MHRAWVLRLDAVAEERSSTLRRIQGLAACLWAVYGVLIHAVPIIVANLIVASVAIASSFRGDRRSSYSGTAAPGAREREEDSEEGAQRG